MNLAHTGSTPGRRVSILVRLAACLAFLLALAWAPTTWAADDGDAASQGAATSGKDTAGAGGSVGEAGDAPEGAASDSDKDKAESAPKGKRWIRGTFEAGTDSSWSDKGANIDFEQYLRLKVDPPNCERLHLRGAAWLIEEAASPDSDHSALRDIYDASEGDFHARLPYLYLDVDDVWGDSVLRVGRQRILEGLAFNRIDRAYFKQAAGQWEWYVFGGTRASYYRTPFRDPRVGGGAAVQATPRTRIALDAFYGHENRDDAPDRGLLSKVLRLSYPRDVEKHIEDTAVSLSVWQTVCEALDAFGRVTWFSDNSAELTLSATGYIEPADLTYEATYKRQVSSFSDRVRDLTGYYRILGSSVAHDTYYLALHRPLSKVLTLSVEGEFRDAHQADWLTANRDYQRYAATLSAENLWEKKVDAEVSLERWNVTDGEGTWAVTGEVAKQWPKVDVAVGADYQRYTDRIRTYDETWGWLTQGLLWFAPRLYVEASPLLFLTGNVAVERHENLHAFYAKTKYHLTKNQDINFKLTFEKDDAPESPYWRIQANYELRF